MQREKIHTRKIVADGYRRSDGMWDIEATIQDVKHYDFQNKYHGLIASGEPFHSMWVCLTIDKCFIIQKIAVKALKGPFEICPNIVINYQRLVGVKIDRTWHREVKKKVGRVEGCTHINELILYLGTVAYQTIMPDLVRSKDDKVQDTQSKRPSALINTCHAWAENSSVTKEFLPDDYVASKK